VYNLSQRFTALLLLFSITLQSCYTPLKMSNKKHALTPHVYVNKSDKTSPSDNANIIELETLKTKIDWLQNDDNEEGITTYEKNEHQEANFATQINSDGAQSQQAIQVLYFYQKHGVWRAKINETFGHLQRSEDLPVICAPSINVEAIEKMPKAQARQVVHRIKYPKDFIYLGKMGLFGGMEEKESANKYANSIHRPNSADIIESDEEANQAASQSNQSNKVNTDQLLHSQTISIVNNFLSSFQELFNPSHSPTDTEDSKLEIESRQILDNINSPLSPISQLLEGINTSTGSPGLKSSESSTIEKLMWATLQHLFPEYFSDPILPAQNLESSNILLSPFVKIIQNFTQGENNPLGLWANEIKEKIEKEDPESDKKMALLELVEAFEKFLKYIGSEDINDPLKDPLNKYVKQDVEEAIKLRSLLQSNSDAKDYDKFRSLKKLEEMEENIRASRFKVMEENLLWMFNLIKRINPAIPADINTPSELNVYLEEEFKKKKREDFFTFLINYKGNQINNPFETNRLRAFWEEVARGDYGTILYQTICESFQENFEDSEPHKIIKQIWILSQLDTIHEQPQEARSRMPNSSIDGKPALNFGYRMRNSKSYLIWVKQPLIGSVGDITVDAFYSILDFGINLDINTFLKRLILNISEKKEYFNHPHIYDNFILPFQSFLLKYVYKQPFIKGKGLRVFKEFDQKELEASSCKVLEQFKEFCEKCKDSTKGFVLGVGFNGKLFNVPIPSIKQDNNEIWLTFSESRRNQSGYLFLELMKEIMKKGNDSLAVSIEELYDKHKALIDLHIKDEIKECCEMLNYYKLYPETLDYQYQESKKAKFSNFKSQVESKRVFKDLSQEFRDWLIQKNFSNWYHIAASNIYIIDKLPKEDERVHNEARNLVFDSILGKFSIKDYPYLRNELFIHWKDEVLNNIDQALAKQIASAKNFDNVPDELKCLTAGILENLIQKVPHEIKDVWMPEINRMFKEFMEEKVKNNKSIMEQIEEANKTISRLKSTNSNNRVSKPKNRGWESPQISQQDQERIDKINQEKLELAERRKKNLEQLMKCDTPANLPFEYYQEFKNSFFSNRGISQCIEPIFSKVLGHDRFMSILISNEDKLDKRKDLRIFGNIKPQRAIEPCNQRCQFHVLGHLYTGDMLFHQNVDQLHNLRKSHNLGEVHDRFMTLGPNNTLPKLNDLASFSGSVRSALVVNAMPASWLPSTIATDLWKNPKAEKHINDLVVNNVNLASAYLESNGYQLQGVKYDGDCFLRAFLESYETLPTKKITTLDEEEVDKISYLRSEAARLYQGDQARRDKIKKNREPIDSEEGGLLAKLGIPIRLVSVNKEGVSDMLFFAESGKEKKLWNETSFDGKPEEYIFIVEVGKHFLWAKCKN
jgi:hypothetical protein